LDQNADLVVLDARRFDEYQTMSIPKATSVPGAELVLRARTLAPRVTTRIVVNCAGRTRSIIGAQSLLNAGIPNPVCALENGTIGWVLAGQSLESGRDQTYGAVNEVDLSKAKMSALALAIRCGVKRIDMQEFQAMSTETTRATYLFDVRSAQEFLEGHLPKAIHAAGGQLVQETDHFVPVRGARVVLYDTEGVRAMMSASWLAQMAWEVYVIKDVRPGDLTRKDTRYLDPPEWSGACPEVTPELLKEWLAQRNNLSLVVDLSSSAHYVKQHIPGAWWLLRSKMKEDFGRVHKANRYILTSEDGLSARFAWAELRSCVKPNVEIFVLSGGTKAWSEKGFSVQQGESYLASARIDRYQRPYEGVQNSAQAMQAYLDWEYGLVEQLRKDATHHFRVV
jgi:rhodanese-related sulfurtransferase